MAFSRGLMQRREFAEEKQSDERAQIEIQFILFMKTRGFWCIRIATRRQRRGNSLFVTMADARSIRSHVILNKRKVAATGCS